MTGSWLPREEFLKTIPLAVTGACALFTDEAGRLLLLHDDWPPERLATGELPRWLPPGGILDHGEDPRATAVREVAEETGLVLAGQARCVGVDFRLREEGWPPVANYFFDGGTLSAAAADGIRLSAEHDEYAFVHLDAFVPRLTPNWRVTLPAMMAARRDGHTVLLHEGQPL